jgi:hypothetical protein
MKYKNGTRNIGAEISLVPKSILFILIASISLCLLITGCGKIANMAVSKGKYTPPTLPKSHLATIQIDSEGSWFQQIKNLALRIDGRLALEQEIDLDRKTSIKEILVSPGQHDLSVGIIYQSFEAAMPNTSQVWTTFSANMEAGDNYLLRGEFSPGVDGELSFDSWLINNLSSK